jgi:hypothetical protein
MLDATTDESNYVLYSPHTDIGKLQGLGNHLYIFYTSYSYCIDNGIEMRIDENAHPVMKNMLLQKQKRINNSYYSIEHLSDLKANEIPFQLHNAGGSSDTNGFDFSLYKHNIPEIQRVLNVPNEPLDACIMHVRVYTALPHLNVGLPFYMNALKHVKSKRVIIMSGYSNFDIKEDVTKKNIDYLLSKLSKIYPDKEFIDIRTMPEYLDEDDDIEAMKHWYLCVNCKELIAPPSTFSLSAAMIRGDRLTITPKHQNLYGATYDLRTVADNVIYITRNMVVSAWYDIPELGGDRDERRKSIKTFFDRVNNANIIIVTNDASIFKEISVNGLSHIWILTKPLEELYGYKFIDIWRSKYEEQHKDHPLFNAKRLAMWYSKLWLCKCITNLFKGSYDRLAWIDLAVFKSSEIVDKMDVFPVFEKYMLPRINMHCLSSIGSCMHNQLFYHGTEFSMVLFPNASYVSHLYELFDIIVTTCFRAGIYLNNDEAYMTLVIDLVGDLFNVSLDRAIGWGYEYGWHHWYFDYSESYDVFVNTIYNDITIRQPKVETSHLQQFLAILNDKTKNNSL